jgi:hypothetical protein
MDEFETQQISFLREQDGPPERELKNQLTELFISDSNVLRAYLVCVAYKDTPGVSVALCIRSKWSENPDLVQQVEHTFRSMFGDREHLDIMFIEEELEARLTKCCGPFFETER